MTICPDCNNELRQVDFWFECDVCGWDNFELMRKKRGADLDMARAQEQANAAIAKLKRKKNN